MGEMLYPLLSLDSGGSHCENIDFLLRNAPIRNIRTVSEMARPRQMIETGRADREGSRGGQRQLTPAYSHYSPNRFGVNRPDRDREYNSSAGRMNAPVLWGKSSSCLGRSKYFSTTPKFRTEYPRFHTGFRFVPIFGHK